MYTAESALNTTIMSDDKSLTWDKEVDVPGFEESDNLFSRELRWRFATDLCHSPIRYVDLSLSVED